jgi:adenosylcobinamide-GDP ribazoletransferase
MRSKGVASGTPSRDAPNGAWNSVPTFLGEAAAAVVLLTRLPLGWAVRDPWPTPDRCVWAYPLVGLLVGAIGAFTLWLAERLGLAPLPAAVLAIAAAAIITGGLHEDGLADMFDALSGGRTVERRLAIMRDSRIGAHGALALVLTTTLRVACLATLPSHAYPTAALLGRAAILVVLATTGPARRDGLAAPLAPVSRRRIACGLAIGVGLAWLCGRSWVWAVIAAGTTGLIVGAIARRRFRGFTGDVLGAASVLAESAALMALQIRQ